MKLWILALLLLLALVAPAAAQDTSSASANLCHANDDLCLYVNLQITGPGATLTYVLRTYGPNPTVLAYGESEPLDGSSYSITVKDGVVIHPRFMIFFDARFPRYSATIENVATVTEYTPDTQTWATTKTTTTTATKAADVEGRVDGKNLTPCWGCGELSVHQTRTE